MESGVTAGAKSEGQGAKGWEDFAPPILGFSLLQ